MKSRIWLRGGGTDLPKPAPPKGCPFPGIFVCHGSVQSPQSDHLVCLLSPLPHVLPCWIKHWWFAFRMHEVPFGFGLIWKRDSFESDTRNPWHFEVIGNLWWGNSNKHDNQRFTKHCFVTIGTKVVSRLRIHLFVATRNMVPSRACFCWLMCWIRSVLVLSKQNTNTSRNKSYWGSNTEGGAQTKEEGGKDSFYSGDRRVPRFPDGMLTCDPWFQYVSQTSGISDLRLFCHCTRTTDHTENCDRKGLQVSRPVGKCRCAPQSQSLVHSQHSKLVSKITLLHFQMKFTQTTWSTEVSKYHATRQWILSFTVLEEQQVQIFTDNVHYSPPAVSGQVLNGQFTPQENNMLWGRQIKTLFIWCFCHAKSIQWWEGMFRFTCFSWEVSHAHFAFTALPPSTSALKGQGTFKCVHGHGCAALCLK